MNGKRVACLVLGLLLLALPLAARADTVVEVAASLPLFLKGN